MEDSLLALLRQRELISRDELDARFGTGSLDEATAALQAKGYAVQRLPDGSLRLEPPENALWPSRVRQTLRTRWAGCRIDYYDRLGSTNRAARELGLDAPASAPHGTVVIADEQTQGRGRMTRSWQCKAGEGLLMSLLLRPEDLPPADAPALVLITALAVCEACRDVGADARIKWPNDIVCGGKKICGILLEMSADAERVRFAVAGIGLNIFGYPYADDLRHASCLSDNTSAEPDRAAVAALILNRFERFYGLWRQNGRGVIDQLYRGKCVTLNSRVQVIGLSETFEGTAFDLTEDGSLIVRRDDGTDCVVRAGDVSVRGIMGYV